MTWALRSLLVSCIPNCTGFAVTWALRSSQHVISQFNTRRNLITSNDVIPSDGITSRHTTWHDTTSLHYFQTPCEKVFGTQISSLLQLLQYFSIYDKVLVGQYTSQKVIGSLGLQGFKPSNIIDDNKWCKDVQGVSVRGTFEPLNLVAVK